MPMSGTHRETTDGTEEQAGSVWFLDSRKHPYRTV